MYHDVLIKSVHSKQHLKQVAVLQGKFYVQFPIIEET